MAFDVFDQAAQFARNFAIECRREHRQRAEALALAAAGVRSTESRPMTINERIDAFVDELMEKHHDAVAALRREKPHLSARAAAFELAARRKPALFEQDRREVVSLADVRAIQEEDEDDASEEYTARIAEQQRANPTMSFEAAMQRVDQDDPPLAERVRRQNARSRGAASLVRTVR